jgi:hypothetical protein
VAWGPGRAISTLRQWLCCGGKDFAHMIPSAAVATRLLLHTALFCGLCLLISACVLVTSRCSIALNAADVASPCGWCPYKSAVKSKGHCVNKKNYSKCPATGNTILLSYVQGA